MPRLSGNGSIVIPRSVREQLGLSVGDEFVIEVRDGEIVMRKRQSIFDYTPPRLRKELGLSDRQITDLAWEDHVAEKFGQRPRNS
jgi:AbrB family looped-hinge helix DNA binding protein